MHALIFDYKCMHVYPRGTINYSHDQHFGVEIIGTVVQLIAVYFSHTCSDMWSTLNTTEDIPGHTSSILNCYYL